MTISIITVTYNAEQTLADCLESIRQQTCLPKHVVIDGGSADRTPDILADHGLDGMKMISKSDQGIYDAMNKGIALSDGDIIGILNADDFYNSPEVLEKVATLFEDSRIEALYGDLVYVDARKADRIIRYWRSGGFDRRKFYWGWMPPHPTVFVRRQVYEKYGTFNLNLGSAADYELMLRLMVKESVNVAYLPEILVRMRTGGVSNATFLNRLRANRMDRKAWQVNGLKPYPWTLMFKPLRKIPQWFVKGK